MIRTSANPLLGMQANSIAARPTAESVTPPFGDILSRELGARQQNRAAAPARPPPVRVNPEKDTTLQAHQSLLRQAAGASEAHVQVRQAAQHTEQAEAVQRSQDAQQRQDAKKSQPVDDTPRQTGTAVELPPAPARGDGDQASKTKAKCAATDSAAPEDSMASGDAAARPAVATSQVWVESLSSQASYLASSNIAQKTSVNAVPDPDAASNRLAPLRTQGADPGINAGAEKPDFALDALLAQATELAQAHGGTAAAGTKSSADAPGLELAAVTLTGSSGELHPASSGAEASLVTVMLAKTGFSVPAENVTTLPTIDAAPTATLGMPAAGVALAHVLPTSAAMATNVLTPHVGTNAWDNALGQKVVWMAAGAEQTASLTLNPPDLGPLQVVINVSNAHAEATFTAAQPEVRQALEAAMPKLKEMMAEAGISLGQTSVNAGSPKQDGDSQQNRSASQPTGHGRRADNVRTGDVDEAGRIRARAVGGGNSLVDIFA